MCSSFTLSSHIGEQSLSFLCSTSCWCFPGGVFCFILPIQSVRVKGGDREEARHHGSVPLLRELLLCIVLLRGPGSLVW